MRAVFVFLLVVLAVSFLAPTASAQRRNTTHVAYYNDSDCRILYRQGDITLPSSTKCVSNANESYIFQCVTNMNQNRTDFSYQYWSSTSTCDGTAAVAYTSSGPMFMCVPVNITVDGTPVTTKYGQIRCEGTAQSMTAEMVDAAREMAGAAQQPTVVAAPGTLADLLTATKKKFRSFKQPA